MMTIDQVEPHCLAAIFAGSPMWARLALTAPDDRMRERAAETMAAIVLAKLAEPVPSFVDEAQMLLPIS